MKELQNNFTTPEQSKKLLELGVPADSADMYYKQYSDAVVYVGEVGDVPQGKTFYIHEPSLRHINPEGTWTWEDEERVDLSGKVDELRKTDIPCWSFGRLVEIYIIARGLDTAYLPIESGEDMVKYIIQLYEEKMKDLDFSKLED